MRGYSTDHCGAGQTLSSSMNRRPVVPPDSAIRSSLGGTLMSLLRTSIMFATALLAIPALADTHISFVDDSGQPSAQMYVKGGKVRIEGSGHERGISIYDITSNTMTLLMPDQDKY